MAERSYRMVLWSLALLGLTLDQGSKYGVFGHGRDHGVFDAKSGGKAWTQSLFRTERGGFELDARFEDTEGAVPHVNHGALFGFLREWETAANFGFAAVSLLAAAAIVFWSRQPVTARDPWLCAALGLILAGTLGNLYDRLVFNGVRDFLHWDLFFDWPVFNLADCCLVLGAGLLLLQAFGTVPAPEPGQSTSAENAMALTGAATSER
jgi:lipoprotein signal peptidase